jgi:hypothetical protein
MIFICIATVIKLSAMILAGNTERMGLIRNAYKIDRKPQRKGPLGAGKCKREDNNKEVPNSVRRKGLDWIKITQYWLRRLLF